MPQIQSAQKKNWVSIVVMGIVVAVVDVPIVISLAILIYSGEMAPYIPFGILDPVPARFSGPKEKPIIIVLSFQRIL